MSIHQLGLIRNELNKMQLSMANMIREIDLLALSLPVGGKPGRPAKNAQGRVACDVSGCSRTFVSSNALGPHRAWHKRQAKKIPNGRPAR